MLPTLKLSHWRGLSAVCLLLVGFQQVASASYIQSKAYLAQYLIALAWENTLKNDGAVEKPWPWADTWPVAKLHIPQQAVELYVLAGATGNALAFGPGHESASAQLGEPGLSVIGGHRDTHFGFLKHLNVESEFSLQLPSGEWLSYAIESAEVVNINLQPMPARHHDYDQLLLVTCYPFEGWFPGGPLRYVVSARSVEADVFESSQLSSTPGAYAL